MSGDDPSLLAYLDAGGHFHRDGRAGRMYHAGQVSLREDVPSDSLHVSVAGNRLRAHVDEASPLAVGGGPSRYSRPRAVVHNLLGMAGDVLALVRGRQGDHRCELDCEWVPGEGPARPRAPGGWTPPPRPGACRSTCAWRERSTRSGCAARSTP